MKIKEYILDKLIYIIGYIIITILIFITLRVFNMPKFIIIIITSIILWYMIIIIIIDYLKKRHFFKTFQTILNNLDQKYLIVEVMQSCSFIEGQLFISYLNEIAKSMHEYVNNYKYSRNEFREYIELWCHEIKTPIATSNLIIENNQNKTTKSLLEELDKIDYYIEQMLFYARSDTVYKDYIIKEVDMKNIIDEVIRRNKKSLINNKIKIIIDKIDKVHSDNKWLGFIINQIITNSIKYMNKNNNSYIRISSTIHKNNVVLTIEDNGIGIKEEELPYIFDKGFTGSNGRINHKATGIGLYLCKKLCLKLGHKIEISSIISKKTVVSITFSESDMLNKLK